MKRLAPLLQTWPSGKLMTTTYLQQLGIQPQNMHAYVNKGWIQKVGHGVFYLANDYQPSWQSAIDALTTQLHYPIHIGGRSALRYWGHQHFIQQQNADVYLFTEKTPIQLPQWVNQFSWKNGQIVLVNKELFPSNEGIMQVAEGVLHFKVSTPERAILEILSQVPQKQEYAEAVYLTESLLNLRPAPLQSLLEQCTSLKVKRLFLQIADMCSLPCMKLINLDKIDLGKGKQMIGEGGYYYPKYHLSVPENPLKEGTDEENLNAVS
ncbi:MAG: type IV toxin-antitoxin system AbiEi family antitoxin domain-containing protein [Gammaproteobacteria bacterium]